MRTPNIAVDYLNTNLASETNLHTTSNVSLQTKSTLHRLTYNISEANNLIEVCAAFFVF
jgi:hypothetical protein